MRDRVRWYAERVPSDQGLPDGLALAAQRALAEVSRHEGDRSAALDLLAADALITLALLAQAQGDPANLHSFAARLLRTELPRP